MNELVNKFQCVNQEFREQHLQSMRYVSQVCEKMDKVHHEMELDNKIQFLKLGDELGQLQQGLERLKQARELQDARLRSDAAQQDRLAEIQQQLGQKQCQTLSGDAVLLIQQQFDEFQKLLREDNAAAQDSIGQQYIWLQEQLTQIRLQQRRDLEERLAAIDQLRQSYSESLGQLRTEVGVLKAQRKEAFGQLFDVLQTVIDRHVEQVDSERQHKIQFQKTLVTLVERCRQRNEGHE